MKTITKEFAILDEHDLVDDKGKVVMNIDAKKLYQIAENNNRRVRDTGDATPIVIGHTKDNASEDRQPEIVGWAEKFTVKDFFKTGRKAIFVKAKFHADKINKVKNYPRRSVELWLRKNLVDPISLLGATTPERDLGVLKFSSDGEKKYVVDAPEDESGEKEPSKKEPADKKPPTFKKEKKPMGNDDIVQEVMAAIQETDVWKFMEAQMMEQDNQDLDGDDDLPMDEGDVPADPAAMGGGDPQSYSPSAASGMNTFPPDKALMKAKGELAKLQSQYKTASHQNTELLRRLRRAERRSDLIQLEAEGYRFDLEEELDDMEDLSEEKYQRALDKVRRYQKAPVNGERFTHSETTRSTHGGMTKDQAVKVAEYATAHNLTFEAAANALSGALPY